MCIALEAALPIEKQQYANPKFAAISRIAASVQRALGAKRIRRVKELTSLGARRSMPRVPPMSGGVRLGFTGRHRRAIKIRSAEALKQIRKTSKKVPTGRKLLAHEITHIVPIRQARHGPVFKSTRRHVEKVMKKTGAMKKLRKMGYALEDTRYVKTYFTEMKQHGVPFRTRMQWLSRVYGGRGGYTSEQLYEIVTGKSRSKPYYIFPFVKSAPPAVNRILEATYRRHRAQLAQKVEAGEMTDKEAKVAAAIASWAKVKQAGYIRKVKPRAAWVKKGSYAMNPLAKKVIATTAKHPIAVSAILAIPGLSALLRRRLQQIELERAQGNYGLAKEAGKAVGRKVKWLLKSPKVVRAGGFAGAGYLVGKRRRQRKVVPMTRYTRLPDSLLGVSTISGMAREPLFKPMGRSVLRGGTRLAKTAGQGAAVALLAAWIIKHVLQPLEKKPYMPAIRPDVELSRYDVFEQVVQYVEFVPYTTLDQLRTKASAVLGKTRKGVEKGMLWWLLGFISAEILARGITAKKQRHEIQFARPVLYARRGSLERKLMAEKLKSVRVDRTIRQLAREAKRKIRRRRLLSGGLKGMLGLAVPTAAVTALLHRMGRRQEEYSVRSALSHVRRLAKKVGGGVSKGTGLLGKVAIPALIISEFIPRKKKLQPLPPVAQGYCDTPQPMEPEKRPPGVYFCPECRGAIIVWRTWVDKYKVRCPKCNTDLQSLRSIPTVRYTRGRGESWAESLLKWKRPPKGKKGLLDALLMPKHKKKERMSKHELVEMYPFKSAAQRRWMHWKKPKMAEEWEEHTPAGKKLPEHVSKHELQQYLKAPTLVRRLRLLLRTRLTPLERVIVGRQLSESLRMGRHGRPLAAGGRAKGGYEILRRKWLRAAEQTKEVLKRKHVMKRAAVATALGVGAGGVVAGKKREKRRIIKAIG